LRRNFTEHSVWPRRKAGMKKGAEGKEKNTPFSLTGASGACVCDPVRGEGGRGGAE
jgi:hypothetical protein